MNKTYRVMKLSEKLNNGEKINKTAIANEFNVSEKTIYRDIEEIRAYYSNDYQSEENVSVKYDKALNVYYLVKFEREWIESREVLAICKIILESRAFSKKELDEILPKIIGQTLPEDKECVKNLLINEMHNYVELQHGKDLLNIIWSLSKAVYKQNIIEISYTRKDKTERKHRVKPVAIMFSEFYFYLITYMADEDKGFPTVFRIDRISDFKDTDEHFRVPYKDKFSDAEFRKRVQFMYTGELRFVTFEYSGASIEAVLDRLPTAEIKSEKDGVYTVRAEVYGNGVDMWLKGQGENVKLI